MNIFISSRGEDSLKYNSLKSLVDTESTLYFDLETIQNNDTVIAKYILDHPCETCHGTGVVQDSIDGIGYDVTCPICRGKKKHFGINIIANITKDNFISNDTIMDNLNIITAGSEEEMYELIASICDSSMIFTNNGVMTIDKTDMKKNFVLTKKQG